MNEPIKTHEYLLFTSRDGKREYFFSVNDTPNGKRGAIQMKTENGKWEKVSTQRAQSFLEYLINELKNN